jgi:hypothetical protein
MSKHGLSDESEVNISLKSSSAAPQSRARVAFDSPEEMERSSKALLYSRGA